MHDTAACVEAATSIAAFTRAGASRIQRARSILQGLALGRLVRAAPPAPRRLLTLDVAPVLRPLGQRKIGAVVARDREHVPGGPAAAVAFEEASPDPRRRDLRALAQERLANGEDLLVPAD